MRPRPGDSPQRSGSRFERIWAAVFGKKPTRGSGNHWTLKLDVGDGSVTWSCKYTEAESIRISKAMLKEADDGVYKNGDNSIPGLAIAIDGGVDTIIAMRAEDFLRLLAQNPNGYIAPSKAEIKRATAKTPILFRDEQG